MIWGISGLRALVTVVMTAVLAAVLALAVVPAHAAAPANDDFADAEDLVGLPVSTTGTTVEATIEEDEPVHGGSARSASIWYSWTAPEAGPVAVDLLGTDFDAVVAVYTGSDIAELTKVTSDAQYGPREARAGFHAEAGTTYRIAVDGESGTGQVELEIAAAGAISGTVTDPHGVGISGIRVSACQVRAIDGSCTNAEFGYTVSDGTYEIGGLPGGEHRIWFRGEGDYLSEYFDDVTYHDQATLLEISDGTDLTGIDATLAELGWISGTVSDRRGVGVEHIRVEVCKWDAESVRCDDASWGASGTDEDVTDSDGSYAVGPLRPGDYKVRFESGNAHVGEWYDGQVDEASATVVSLPEGSDVFGIDAELAIPGSISGTVTDRDGVAMNDIVVEVCQWSATDDACAESFRRYTNTRGDYIVGGLAAGDYKIRFGSDSLHYGEWHDNADSGRTASTVTLAQDEAVMGIDAQLTSRSSISGTVTDSAGVGIEGIRVEVCPVSRDDGPAVCSLPDRAVTDEMGRYTVTGLGEWRYTVEFQSDGTYVDDMYPGRVEVGYSEAVTGIDAELLTEAEWEAANAPKCAGQAATIVGTSGDDVLVGTDGADVIHGLAGDDTIRGLGGDDVICGGGGADELRGGPGKDLVIGGSGDDRLYGGGAGDTLRGGPGKDLLKGHGGSDTLIGGGHGDRLVGGGGNDVLKGKAGWDVLAGNRGNDILRGNNGRDKLRGGSGKDRLIGGGGRDRCNGGGGFDRAKLCEVLRRIP